MVVMNKIGTRLEGTQYLTNITSASLRKVSDLWKVIREHTHTYTHTHTHTHTQSLMIIFHIPPYLPVVSKLGIYRYDLTEKSHCIPLLH